MSESIRESVNEQHAWALLTAARRISDECLQQGGFDPNSEEPICALRHSPAEGVTQLMSGKANLADILLDARNGWSMCSRLALETRHLLELYLPVLGRPCQPQWVVAHLGQSLDSRIATSDGDAFFVTGEQNRKHLHRLRSLCQAVLVGAGTVQADNPQLTTRAVSGRSPVRVVIDPQARLSRQFRVFEDGQASTWLLHDRQCLDQAPATPAGCRRLGVESVDGQLQPQAIIDALRSQGIHRVFIEGGGVTVSRFLDAGCLHSLQLAVAPVLVGEGVPALQIPGARRMLDALRPPHRVFRMGEDVLWDFNLSAQEDSADSTATAADSEIEPSVSLLWRRF